LVSKVPKARRPTKRRSRQYKPADWTTGRAKARFPFSLFRNVKLFYIIGALIMIGSVAPLTRLTSSRGKSSAQPTPQATAETTPTPEGTPQGTPTVAAQRYSGPPAMTIDTNKSYSAIIHTDKGDIKVELFAQQAPQTVNNFVFLARDGFYNGLTFFWVKPDFVAQTGDPEETGHGGPGYTIPDENSGVPFQAGTVGMAKKADEPNSGGSQFFITLTDQPQLTGEFTSFGRVVAGMDILSSLTPRDPPSADLPPGDKVLSIDIQES
jgi:cyclophilin family peptidyl-prolyl cis-trans isomerase